MELDFWTIVLLSFGIGYLIGFVKNRMKNKITRSAVARFIGIINKIINADKNGISAMEYNDRYTITCNIKELDFDMVRLLKGEKKLLIKEEELKLTDKEYEQLLETLKPVL
jgi:hypothetical protein